MASASTDKIASVLAQINCIFAFMASVPAQIKLHFCFPASEPEIRAKMPAQIKWHRSTDKMASMILPQREIVHIGSKMDEWHRLAQLRWYRSTDEMALQHR